MKHALFLVGIVFVCTCIPIAAEDGKPIDPVINELRLEIAALKSRLAELERENAALKSEAKSEVAHEQPQTEKADVITSMNAIISKLPADCRPLTDPVSFRKAQEWATKQSDRKVRALIKVTKATVSSRSTVDGLHWTLEVVTTPEVCDVSGDQVDVSFAIFVTPITEQQARQWSKAKPEKLLIEAELAGGSIINARIMKTGKSEQRLRAVFRLSEPKIAK